MDLGTHLAYALQALKDEIAAINKAADGGPEKLLDHIYKAHPPQHPSHKLSAYSPDKVKKLLQTAITHYHPDRVQNRSDSDQRFVLCEEICKSLTAKYVSYK